MNFPRSSGLLLHITSLPSNEGIGTLGREAFHWVDRLAAAGQKLWQVLPLGPTGYGNSPYQSYSAFAGNPLIIDLEALSHEGWLLAEEMGSIQETSSDRVDFDTVRSIKDRLLRKAFERFHSLNREEEQVRFRSFELSQVGWLEDYALFMALHHRFEGRPWSEWEEGLRRREAGALESARHDLFAEIEFQKFQQFCFFEQWDRLKRYANAKGVEIIGDLPIYLAYDSSECWAHPELFAFDEELRPAFVAGVPPDYFSATGQLWGNPLFDWERLEAGGFGWWIERVRHTLRLYDRVRIDHFRGFEAYWAVPAEAETAAEGEWRPGPGVKLFEALEKALGELPVIAEDLGIITPEVEELRDRFGFPGMKVLQFAFDGNPANPYLPHNHIQRSVLYTGTHDNDTTLGWFRSLQERSYPLAYLASDEEHLLWDLIRTQQRSVAAMAILPLQDLLGLGSEARMNTPGTVEGNWAWRCTPEQWRQEEPWKRLARFSHLYGRSI